MLISKSKNLNFKNFESIASVFVLELFHASQFIILYFLVLTYFPVFYFACVFPKTSRKTPNTNTSKMSTKQKHLKPKTSKYNKAKNLKDIKQNVV
jgi:hypothetical protein